MHLIVIGWLYVVLMMAITEDSVVAGIMTFVSFGAIPVGLIVYIGGARGRRRRKAEAELKPPTPVDAENSPQPGSTQPDQ